MRRPDRRRRAFTLVEVLVALAIFAMAAAVLGSAFVNVLTGYEIARRSNETDSDLSFARSQLLALSDLTAAQDGAEFDDGDRHVKWKADIEPTDTTDLFTVTFTCTVTQGSSEPAVATETFMLLRPTWSDPTVRTTLRQKAADRIAQVQGRSPQ